MIVEIGTSDFRTKAGQVDGLFIEPVKPYFDRLPDCRKENVAISNRTGEVYIFYMEPKTIKSLGLPSWVKGCNSINQPHPTVQRLLYNMFGAGSEEKYIKQDTVRVERIVNLINKYKITYIDCLKIDTEGHDTVIVNDFLDTVSIRPKEIIFEANELSKRTEINKTITKLQRQGYKVNTFRTDVIAKKL